MFRRILISSSALICSCSMMPGMQNLNTVPMRKYVVQEKVKVHPTLIPITPSLIADQKVNTYYYLVAPSDILNISVWQHPEFQMDVQMLNVANAASSSHSQPGYLVNSTGNIFFPLIGDINVAQKTVDEIRSLITAKLKKYIPNPQVQVRVSEFRGQKIYVLGEVKNKGFIAINDQPMTIADALAISGWLDMGAADPGAIYVIRGNYISPQIFWLDARTPDKLLLAERFSLQPQDILYVSSAPVANMNRALSQLLPIVQTVWFTKSIIDPAV